MKKCAICEYEFKPYRNTQKYCSECSKKADKERKRKWYAKNNPDAYKPKTPKKCCICGGEFSGSIDGKEYCNSHWQKVYRYGTPDGGSGSKNKFIEKGDITEVYTTKGEKFIIDTEDIEKIKCSTWCKNKSGYLVAKKDGKNIRLHRFILDYNGNLVVDHINGDITDNRKSNLRICTQKNNSRNTTSPKNSKLGILGVNLTAQGKYRARIMVDRKEIELGIYETLEAAIEARRKAELIYFKEYSRR